MSAAQVRQEVAVRVADAVGQSGRSQANLATAAGIPVSSLSRKVRGLSPFYVPELIRIAEVLDVEPGRFVQDVLGA